MLDFLGKMKDIQSKMEETKNKLESTKVVGINRDASAKVTVNGARRVLDIEINDQFYAEHTKDEVLQAIKDAMQDATNKSEALIKEEMKGAMPQIPGLNFE
jgi:DNA-binding YbaB/EbfC family protein